MTPEIIISGQFKEGFQQDGTIIVSELSPFGSSETLIEHRKEGVFYYLFSRNKATYWIKALLPYVDFDENQKKLVGKQVAEGIKMLSTNPEEKIVIRLDFSPKEAQFFSSENIVRFMNQEVLNDTFLKVLPRGTIEGWGVGIHHWREDFIEKIQKTVEIPH